MAYFDWYHHITARSESSDLLMCSSRKMTFYNMTIMVHFRIQASFQITESGCS